MSATLTHRQIGDVVVVDVVGKITWGKGTVALYDEILSLLKEDKKKIILNLAETVYIDGSGIVELVSCSTKISNREGQLKLLALTKQVKGLLQVADKYRMFEVFADEAAAVASFDKQSKQL